MTIYNDDRTYGHLTGLAPKAREAVQAWLKDVWTLDIPVVLIEGYRSIAEQNDLYAQGRTKPGKIVTNVKGGQSWHNYGLAVDFVIFDERTATGGGGKPHWESPHLEKVAQIAESHGLEWGGRWKMKDTPHLQYNPKRVPLAQAIKIYGGTTSA